MRLATVNSPFPCDNQTTYQLLQGRVTRQLQLGDTRVRIGLEGLMRRGHGGHMPAHTLHFLLQHSAVLLQQRVLFAQAAHVPPQRIDLRPQRLVVLANRHVLRLRGAEVPLHGHQLRAHLRQFAAGVLHLAVRLPQRLLPILHALL